MLHCKIVTTALQRELLKHNNKIYCDTAVDEETWALVLVNPRYPYLAAEVEPVIMAALLLNLLKLEFQVRCFIKIKLLPAS